MKRTHPDIIPEGHPGPQWLRPARAATQFDVSRSTLERWVKAGLIRRSRPTGGTCWLHAGDIADLIASGASSRTVVPIASAPPVTDDESWRGHRLFQRAKR